MRYMDIKFGEAPGLQIFETGRLMLNEVKQWRII